MTLLLLFVGSGSSTPTPVVAVPIQKFDIATFFESNNISIIAKQPLWVGTGLVDDSLAFKVDSYSHEKGADGGYISCGMSLSSDIQELEDWFSNGLGRHIEIYNEAQVQIWEGFVNRVSISLGSLKAERGPLMNISNKVKAIYQTVQYNTIPPIGGNRAEYPDDGSYVQDTDSQARYGVLESVISAGEGDETTIAQFLDTYLAENSYAETTQTINPGSNAKPQISIECRGYRDFFTRYTYSNTNTGTDTATDIITDVVNSDPNSLFDTGGITSNTLQVPQAEQSENKAESVIKNIVALGDSSDNRWTFGVHNGRKVVYQVADTAITYYHLLSDPGQWIETATGQKLLPWNIQAGKWLFINDFLIGLPAQSPINQDPRAIYIESVRFTAPWTIEINGGKASKLPQQLAKLGLGGL